MEREREKRRERGGYSHNMAFSPNLAMLLILVSDLILEMMGLLGATTLFSSIRDLLGLGLPVGLPLLFISTDSAGLSSFDLSFACNKIDKQFAISIECFSRKSSLVLK